ncbi:HAD hydrolase-like protein [Candidatus Woesearchaeota archaeon]|nr:HAD hydrolase-like protein [Candidatus Woesearchaeota archaeon]
MSDHRKTVKQAVRKHLLEYFKPSSYRVTYRLKSIGQLSFIERDYDLILFDRDCTLHGYHAQKRLADFEPVLQQLKSKGEIVSNSSFDEFCRIRDVFGDLFPISKLVRFEYSEHPHLLRFVNGKLTVIRRDSKERTLEDRSSQLCDGDRLLDKIVYDYRKPDPQIIFTVIAANINEQRVKEFSKVLMVGDRYLTDVVAGNLAGVHTALVDAVEQHTETIPLLLGRLLVDIPVGAVMSRIAKMLE